VEKPAEESQVMRKIVLDSLHRELKARMVPFAGYEMPVSYKGIIEEHQTVRKAVGIFDISHMGIVVISGERAVSFLDTMFTKPASKVAVGKGAYALLCNELGNTLDDLIFYRTAENQVVVALNASNKENDLDWIKKHAFANSSMGVTFEVRFDSHALFAVQGARAPEFLKSIGVNLNYDQLYNTGVFSVAGVEAQYFVSGYTGEKGCEISVPNRGAEKLFRFLLETGAPFGIQPCGLGCRDTLRTEMGYSLYGHELSPEINPVEASLSWAVDFNSNFIGKDALVKYKENPRRKLIAFQNTASRQAPRSEMRIFDAAGKDCGFVTSGTFSPTLGYVVGMGIVEVTAQVPVSIDMRGTKVPFEITKRPFIKK
jgi:aminomethyltransferase